MFIRWILSKVMFLFVKFHHCFSCYLLSRLLPSLQSKSTVWHCLIRGGLNNNCSIGKNKTYTNTTCLQWKPFSFFLSISSFFLACFLPISRIGSSIAHVTNLRSLFLFYSSVISSFFFFFFSFSQLLVVTFVDRWCSLLLLLVSPFFTFIAVWEDSIFWHNISNIKDF